MSILTAHPFLAGSGSPKPTKSFVEIAKEALRIEPVTEAPLPTKSFFAIVIEALHKSQKAEQTIAPQRHLLPAATVTVQQVERH
jgi:hypothetical protein